MTRLLIATGNRHKTGEIRAMLGDGFIVEDLKDHPELESPEETGETFEENARIKAVAASVALPGLWVLADDSGLEVDALDGAPGVKSARYAGTTAGDADNRELLKRNLRALAPRDGPGKAFQGRFRCCMVLAQNGEALAAFDGAVDGKILLKEEGEGGFGYDPLFVPEGFDNSFGVLPAEIKNQLSHRARALAKVVEWLRAKGSDGVME